MSDREIVGAEVVARGPNVSRSTPLRIVKKGALKVYKYRDNSSPPRCRLRDIKVSKRKKRGG